MTGGEPGGTGPGERVRRAFADPQVAAHYARARFPARRQRLEEGALRRLLPLLPPGPCVDVACGAGRMAPVVGAGRLLVGVDSSEAMLREARAHGEFRGVLCGDAFALPFPDGAFAAGTMIRLLPHLGGAERRAVLAELARVVRGRAVVSFLDAGTLEALRSRGKRTARPASRRAVPLREVEADLRAAGWRVVRVARKLGRITEHTFLAVERHPPAG